MARWFRRKTFGYGWTPASWEGWMATLLCIMAVVAVADPRILHLDPAARIVCIVALVACLFAVTLATSGGDSDE